jgi:hypothetical protein
MAIGKVGAYATVEGGIVDYGKMAYGAIDDVLKDDAIQKKLAQDKAQAAAKLKVEREKLKIDLDKFEPITGQGGISELVSKDLGEMADGIYAAKSAYAEGRIPISKVESLQQAYNQRVSELKLASDTAKSTFALVQKDADKIEPESLNEISDQANALLGGNYIVSKDSNGRRVYQKVEKNAKGEVTKVLQEFNSPMDITSSWKPLYKFDLAADVENFTKKEAPLSTYTDFAGLTKIESTTIEQNPKVNEAINNHVRNALSDPNTLASLYKKMSGEYKRNVTDPKDITATAEWYKQRLMDGYTEKVTKDKHYYALGDGDGGKNKLSVGTFDPSGSFTIKVGNTELDYGTGALSDGLTLTDPTNKKNEFVLKTLTLFEGGKKVGIASNPTIQNIVIDKQGRWVVEGSYVDTKSTTYKAKNGTIFDILDTAIDKVPRSEQKEFLAKKKELELSMAQGGEERKRFIQPVGESVVSYIINRLKSANNGKGQVMNGVRITDENSLKQAMNYNEGSSVPTASNSEWISAGWTQSQINEAVKSGKIKVQ